LDTKRIEQALGRAGRDIGGGVSQVTVPRAETITEMGVPLLPAMGVVTVLNFQPLDGGKAAITGDFVLTDREMNAVARALRQHGIEVTAIHNHGLMDSPRLFYMHFWSADEPTTLAQGLKTPWTRPTVRNESRTALSHVSPCVAGDGGNARSTISPSAE
jgi:hypothetical protein